MSKPKWAWSYSALTSFEQCPKRFYETKIAKNIVEPQTEATLWGNAVHKALEHRLSDGTPLPDKMQQYEPIAAKLANAAVGKTLEVEQKLALNSSFEPTKFFAKDVWVRSIADFIISKGETAFIGDHKTGKMVPDSSQLELSAAVVMHHKPWIKKVVNTFIWLKEGKVTTEKFAREDLPNIWAKFLPRVRRVEHALEANKFPPMPSGLCRKWCPVHTCEHNGNYRGH